MNYSCSKPKCVKSPDGPAIWNLQEYESTVLKLLKTSFSQLNPICLTTEGVPEYISTSPSAVNAQFRTNGLGLLEYQDRGFESRSKHTYLYACSDGFLFGQRPCNIITDHPTVSATSFSSYLENL
jgi:hypothetical protein